MVAEFAPKDAEVLKSEVLEDLGIEYEGNEEQIDKLVSRRLKDEEFKASLHADKNKHLEGKKKYEERMKKAGLDPETGEKTESNDLKPTGGEKVSLKDRVLEARALENVHEDDVEELAEYAERKGVTLWEAKKSPYLQAFFKTRKEERASADAANTGTTRRSNKQDSDEALIAKMEKDEDMTDEERQRAVAAQFRLKRKK